MSKINSKFKFGFIQFNKVFIQLENQVIKHHYYHSIIKACKNFVKKCINSRQKSSNWPILRTLAWKKYTTTTDCNGYDWYQLWSLIVMRKMESYFVFNVIRVKINVSGGLGPAMINHDNAQNGILFCI